MISTRQFEQDLAGLTPDEFEELVYQVVYMEHPDAQRLKAPDFGADVLDDPAARHPRLWQVKHYPGPRDIPWKKCEGSLDRATTKWRPSEVTFVFPRDLTAGQQQAFREHLVNRAPDKPIPVKPLTATALNAALERFPAIRRSFFPHRTDALHEVLKAAKLAERPADAPAFLEHGLDLADLVDELDPNFHYELRSRPAGIPEARWAQPPFMAVRIEREGKQSIMEAWSKPGVATEAEATWSFSEDDAGEQARRLVYLALARGEPVEVPAGVNVQAQPTPRSIAAILEGAELESVRFTVVPRGEPVPLCVSWKGPAGNLHTLDFELRSAPPKPEDDGAWVGLTSDVFLYLGFRQRGPTSVTLLFSPTMHLTASAGRNAAVVATMIDLLTHSLRLVGPLVQGEADLDLRPQVDPEDVERLEELGRIYGAMIEIEARTGVSLRVPNSLARDDIVAALNLAELLRDRRATGTARLATTLHVDPARAAPVALRLSESRQVAVPFEQDLLGQTIRYGWSRLTFDKVTVNLVPPSQDHLAALRLVAEGGVEVQLIEDPLPSDVAVDPATGNWNTSVV